MPRALGQCATLHSSLASSFFGTACTLRVGKTGASWRPRQGERPAGAAPAPPARGGSIPSWPLAQPELRLTHIFVEEAGLEVILAAAAVVVLRLPSSATSVKALTKSPAGPSPPSTAACQPAIYHAAVPCLLRPRRSICWWAWSPVLPHASAGLPAGGEGQQSKRRQRHQRQRPRSPAIRLPRNC